MNSTEETLTKKAFFSNLKVQLGEESKIRFLAGPMGKERTAEASF